MFLQILFYSHAYTETVTGPVGFMAEWVFELGSPYPSLMSWKCPRILFILEPPTDMQIISTEVFLASMKKQQSGHDPAEVKYFVVSLISLGEIQAYA